MPEQESTNDGSVAVWPPAPIHTEDRPYEDRLDQALADLQRRIGGFTLLDMTTALPQGELPAAKRIEIAQDYCRRKAPHLIAPKRQATACAYALVIIVIALATATSAIYAGNAGRLDWLLVLCVNYLGIGLVSFCRRRIKTKTIVRPVKRGVS